VFDPASLPTPCTVNVPLELKVCTLKSPCVAIVPPVAWINCALDFPCRSDIPIAPLGASASVLTAVAPILIVVEDGEISNSVFTWESDIVPVGKVILITL
jgi:hypothetical protein